MPVYLSRLRSARRRRNRRRRRDRRDLRLRPRFHGRTRRRCRGRAGCGRLRPGRRRSELRIERRLIFLIGLHRAQSRDVFLMLLVCLGKGMTAGAVGDEIKLARARRIGGGFERGPARIGDRPRRQSGNDISIVRRRLLDFALGDRPPERALAADQAVNNRRIGLQLHILLEPIDEDGGDAGALVGLAGFLLDDRCQHHQLIGRLERQVRRTVIPDFLHHALLRLLHALDQLLAADAAGEVIGIGQQRALARNLPNVADQNVVIRQAGDDLLGGQPLRHADLMLDDFALDHRGNDVAHACMRLELILAGLEIVVGLEHHDTADEDIRLIDDTLLLQNIGNVAHP